MNEVETDFQTISDETFEALMNEAPPAEKSPEIKGGTRLKEVKEVVEDKVVKKEDPKETDTEKSERLKAEREKQQEKEIAGIDEAVDTETGSGPINLGTHDTDPIDLTTFFKTKAEGLIERGIWQEFEGQDTFEWNEENYGKLAEVQAEWKAEEKFAERLDKTGDIGKVIIDHIERGGNPDEILDLFKASRRIETFDIKTPVGKENLVREYYSKVIGWPEAKVDKYVKGLIDSGDDKLTEEATDAKTLMDQGIRNQIKATEQATKDAQRQQQLQAQAWESNITKTITDRKDLSDIEKSEIKESILKYNIKLPDGRVVNKYMVKFMEMQADPQHYIDLVRFVMSPDKYKAKVDKEANSEAAKKSWEFIKGNAAAARSTGTSHIKTETKGKNDLVIDYRKLI